VTEEKVKVEKLTEEQKRANFEWWRRGMGSVWLSEGIKKYLEEIEKPAPIPVSDRLVATAARAVSSAEVPVVFLPRDERHSPTLEFGQRPHSSDEDGPFSLIYTAGVFRNGVSLPTWILLDGTNREVRQSNETRVAFVEKLVSVVQPCLKVPLGEKIVELPTPGWIKTMNPHYCLETEYQPMVEEFIRSLVEIKKPKPPEK